MCDGMSLCLANDCEIGALVRGQYRNISTAEKGIYLRKVNTKRAHIHAVQKRAKVFVESPKTLIEELQVHHVGLQIGHAIAQLCECRLQGVEREV